ncbi:MAG: uridine diphosphate-N-acetylglucosamine-binding protein YvcK [Candidatus Planktophila sp.]
MVSPRVVALGGGHGLFATLTALRSITSEITAVVTVADNGGSSGRLRDEFPIFPPGDLRMALAALCADDEWGRSWAEIMQYRFTSEGPLNGHAVGNLLLAALWDRDEDPVAGLDRVGALLKVVGRVLPMASQPLDIQATFIDGGVEKTVRGQKEVATTSGQFQSLALIPHNPPSRLETLDAIAQAEWITMGPGSWISSVLPHLLVPQQVSALIASSAKKILLLNLDNPESDEFAGRSALDHMNALQKLAPELSFDFVVADTSLIEDSQSATLLREKVSTQGGELLVRDLRLADQIIHHDTKKLASLFAHIAEKTLVG